MRKILLSLVLIFLSVTFCFAYTETFYVREDGTGESPESGCANSQSWDLADLHVAGNWASGVDSDDGKIGANDRVIFCDDGGDGTYTYSSSPLLNILGNGATDKRIRFEAESGATITFDAENTKARCISSASKTHLYFKDLTLVNATAGETYNYGFIASGTSSDDITVDNLTVHDCQYGIYFYEGVTNSEIKNCTVYDTDRNGITLNKSCQNVTIDNNDVHNCSIAPANYHNITIEAWAGGEENYDIFITNNESSYSACQGIELINSERVLIEGNDCHHSGATGINIENGCKYVVVRDNTSTYNDQNALLPEPIYGEGGIFLDEAHYVLIENNISAHNYDIGLSISNKPEKTNIGTKNVIFRNNIQYDNVGDAIWILDNCWGNRFVHNTFYNHGSQNYREREHPARGSSYGNVYKNNIGYTDNSGDDDGKEEHGDNDWDYNCWYDPTQLLLYWVDTQYGSVAALCSGKGQDCNGIEADPKFVDADNYDFHLESDSPCIDEAGPLTNANGGGENTTTLVVDDNRYFYDGYNIAGESGDWIVIDDVARQISDVSSDNETITLTSAASWDDGDPIYYRYDRDEEEMTGSAPDIGAFEYQEAGSTGEVGLGGSGSIGLGGGGSITMP